MKRALLLTAGMSSLALGVVGIVVPVLPTTPFLLLAAACFLRSSRRLHDWLVSHRVLGAFIADYLQHRAVPRRTKIVAVAVLWAGIGLSAYVVQNVWVRLALLAVAVGVTVHLATLKNLKR